MMKAFIILWVLLSCVVPAEAGYPGRGFSFVEQASKPLSAGDRKVARAFRKKTGGFMVRLRGKIIRRLPDDTYGSRHQRFILQLQSGQTLLVSHNIDLARRVPRFKINDKLTLFGEYVWNDKGGVIHKTHRNTDGSPRGGWIRYKGVKIQ